MCIESYGLIASSDGFICLGNIFEVCLYLGNTWTVGLINCQPETNRCFRAVGSEIILDYLFLFFIVYLC